MVRQFDISENSIDEGWSIEEIYKRWLELCGPQEIDGHLIEFIKGEFSSIIESEKGLETIKLIQKLMINLLELAIDDRSPVKKLNLEQFKEDLSYEFRRESLDIFVLKVGRLLPILLLNN